MPKTPTKTPTRTSPRKKAWASPAKSATKLFSSIFKEEDFSPLNKSWAEITEEDSNKLTASGKAERTRKNAVPKRAATKPKFEKSLELTEAVYGSGKKSERRPREEKTEKARTPKQTRKRHLSTSTIDESEGASPSKRAVLRGSSSTGRPARKNAREETPKTSSARVRLFNNDTTPSNSKSVHDAPDDKKYCKDEKTLARRTREIDRAKEKPIYAKYLEMVPKNNRNVDSRIHPRTPNKLLNYSRRSWDSQMRIWKRRLYVVCGEEPSESVAGSESECDSLNTSMHSVDNEELDYEDHNLENKPVLSKLTDIVIRSEPDAMASLLGRFEMDTRSGGESTLKAPTSAMDATGPVDFSSLTH